MNRSLAALFGIALAGCTLPHALPPASAGQEATAPTTADKMPTPAALEALIGSFDVPGLAVATLTGCRVDGVTTVGTADLEAGTPVTKNTAFEAASLSKPVFAYLVLQLADEGVIDLDAPIARTLAYPRIEDQDAYAAITPRMVLLHRTGMPNWVGDTDDERRADPIPFVTAPGAAYSYSGEAFELLRSYVEAQTGKTLAALFEERLGGAMPLSTFEGPLPEGAEPSRGYRSARNPASGRGLDIGGGGAAGGLVTTIGDYARFVGRVCEGEGLSAEARRETIEGQAPVPPGDNPAPTSRSLGWAVMTMGPEVIVMHDGNNDEYRTIAAFLPETGEGYVFLTNGRNGADLIMALIEQLS